MIYKFEPRTYWGNIIIFFIIFSIFWCVGLVFLSGLINAGNVSKLPFGFSFLNSYQNLGLLIMVFTSLVLAVMLFKVLAVGSYYLINDQGILISINWFKREFTFNEIYEIKKVTYEEVQQIALSLRQEQLNYGNIGEVLN